MVLHKNVLLIIFCSLMLFTGCKESPKSNTPAGDSQENQTTITPEPLPETAAICIWEAASLREAPVQGSTRTSLISLGESITWLGLTSTDSTAERPIEYGKVRLSDGVEGWMSMKLFLLEAKVVAVTQSIPLYIRPDMLTITTEVLAPLSVVGIIDQRDGWLKVVSAKLEHEGWIRDEGISHVDEDVSVAIFVFKALEQRDKNKQKEQLQFILDQPSLANSIFIPDVREIVDPTPIARDPFGL